MASLLHRLRSAAARARFPINAVVLANNTMDLPVVVCRIGGNERIELSIRMIVVAPVVVVVRWISVSRIWDDVN